VRIRAALVALACACPVLAVESPAPAPASTLTEVGRIALPADVKAGFSLVSPSGRELTVACADRKLRVFALPPAAHAAPAAPLRTWALDGEPITWLAYSRDGTWLAASTRKGVVGIFRAGHDESAARLVTARPDRSAEITAVAIAPDGSRVAIAPASAPPEIWDVATGTRRAVLATRFGGANALEFSPDGTRLASADEDTALRLYDADGRLRATTDDLLLEPFALAFTADGTQLAVAGADKTVTVLDAVTGKVARTLPRQENPILWVIAPRRGGPVLTGSFDEKSMAIPGPVMAWTLDGASPRVVARERRFVGGGPVEDGRILLVSAADGALVVWSVR
jgi:WD40 repeat protein